MSSFLRRAGAILWFVVGFVGIGVLVGFFWLDDAFVRVHGTTPAVALVPAGIDSRGTCALPKTIDEFHRGQEAIAAADPSTYVDGLVRCVRSDGERSALIAMLRAAAAADDTLAARALEAIVRSSCETMVAVSIGAPPTSATVETCVDLAMSPTTTPSDDADTRARTLRVAQRLTLLEAGVATDDVIAQFCTDIGLLPHAVHDQIAALDPSFTSTIAQVCGDRPHTDDADVEEP